MMISEEWNVDGGEESEKLIQVNVCRIETLFYIIDEPLGMIIALLKVSNHLFWLFRSLFEQS